MIDHPFYDQFRELSWRRKLTPAEEAELAAWLRTHPEMQAQWEAEVGLTDALIRLPEAPLSSNFTARVLAAARQPLSPAASAQARRLWVWDFLLAWRVRLGLAAVVMLAGVASVQHFRYAHRVEMAKSLKAVSPSVSEVAALPENILQDFDAIQRLSSSPPPDEELLKLLQ